MNTIETTTEIAATPDHVWAVLTGLLLNEGRIRNGFEAMNDALKRRVEAIGTADVRDTGDGVAV